VTVIPIDHTFHDIDLVLLLTGHVALLGIGDQNRFDAKMLESAVQRQ